jgi:hypothetical protein
MLRKNTPTTVERKPLARILFAMYSQPHASPRVPPGNLASDDSTTALTRLQAGNSIFRSYRVPSLLSLAGIQSELAKTAATAGFLMITSGNGNYEYPY